MFLFRLKWNSDFFLRVQYNENPLINKISRWYADVPEGTRQYAAA